MEILDLDGDIGVRWKYWGEMEILGVGWKYWGQVSWRS
jgi:hypothetical protein